MRSNLSSDKSARVGNCLRFAFPHGRRQPSISSASDYGRRGSSVRIPSAACDCGRSRKSDGLHDYAKGYRLSAAQIVRAGLLPGRSKDSISQQMKRQGLGDPRRRQAARTAHRLQAEERAALKRFLRARGHKLASAQVAQRFKISPQTVTAYRRRWKLQLSWHGARASASYRQRAEKLRRLFIQRTRARWTEWRSKRREALKNLQWQMRRDRHLDGLRQCIHCGEEWLAVKEFFALTKRRRGGAVTYTMSLTCRACRAELHR